MNAVKEVELKQKEDNQNAYQTVLQQKEQQLSVKEAKLNDFERSLIEREQ